MLGAQKTNCLTLWQTGPACGPNCEPALRAPLQLQLHLLIQFLAVPLAVNSSCINTAATQHTTSMAQCVQLVGWALMCLNIAPIPHAGALCLLPTAGRVLDRGTVTSLFQTQLALLG
jgi:hypothetical protein